MPLKPLEERCLPIERPPAVVKAKKPMKKYAKRKPKPPTSYPRQWQPVLTDLVLDFQKAIASHSKLPDESKAVATQRFDALVCAHIDELFTTIYKIGVGYEYKSGDDDATVVRLPPSLPALKYLVDRALGIPARTVKLSAEVGVDVTEVISERPVINKESSQAALQMLLNLRQQIHDRNADVRPQEAIDVTPLEAEDVD